VTIDGGACRPVMILCFARGHEYPDVAGVYATVVET